MNNNFIAIKTFLGELKFSHKKSDFGITVSTKELIYQKPHANYHIKLEDLISIVPFDSSAVKGVTFHSRSSSGHEQIKMSAGSPHYRLYVREAVLHNRSGLFSIKGAQFILPIHKDLLMAISKYSGLSSVI